MNRLSSRACRRFPSGCQDSADSRKDQQGGSCLQDRDLHDFFPVPDNFLFLAAGMFQNTLRDTRWARFADDKGDGCDVCMFVKVIPSCNNVHWNSCQGKANSHAYSNSMRSKLTKLMKLRKLHGFMPSSAAPTPSCPVNKGALCELIGGAT